MKLNKTSQYKTPGEYTGVIHNCNLSPCELSWCAPFPSVSSIEIYIDYGEKEPISTTLTIVDTCEGVSEILNTEKFVVAKNPDGNWYGVYKEFDITVNTYDSLIIHASVIYDDESQESFFSEQICTVNCGGLTKISACMPKGSTDLGFDVNDIYYGLPIDNEFSGDRNIRYENYLFVRGGKVIETSNSLELSSFRLKNFKSVVNKRWKFEFELVPKWFKEFLLAIYARGIVSIDSDVYAVEELNFEALNEDDLTWKAWATLKSKRKLYFGCSDYKCVDCCNPIITDITFEDASCCNPIIIDVVFNDCTSIFSSEFGIEYLCGDGSASSSEGGIIPNSYNRMIEFERQSYGDNETDQHYLSIDSSLLGTGTDYYVDWGDGNIENVVILPGNSGDELSHTYTTSGTYLVRVFYKLNDVIAFMIGYLTPSPDTVSFTHSSNCTSLDFVEITNVLDINNCFPPALSNMHSLNCYGSSNSIMSTIDLSSYTISYIALSDFPALTTILNVPSFLVELSINNCPSMTNLDSGGTSPAFTTLDLKPSGTLATFALDLSACSTFTYLDSLIVSEVNNYLVAIDANGINNGYFNTQGQSPSATPTGAGATAKANLISKGWTVATD